MVREEVRQDEIEEEENETVTLSVKDLEEEMKEEKELEERIKKAEEKLRQKPVSWRPQLGEMKAVELVSVEKRESENGSEFEVFILNDLRSGQKYSLISCGLLKKHLYPGKRYLLRYDGKVEAEIEGEIRQVHSWSWVEI